MKNALLALALGALLLSPAAAQSPSPGPSTNAHGRPNRPQGGGQGGPIARLKSEMNLTDAQAQRLQPLLKGFMEKNRERMKARQQNMKTVLTPEQFAQLQQMREQHRQGQSTQDGPPPAATNQPAGKGSKHRGPMSQLNLTEEQKEQLKTFNQQTMQEAKADRDALLAQTKSFLNADQQSKLETFLKRPPGPMQGGGRPNKQ